MIGIRTETTTEFAILKFPDAEFRAAIKAGGHGMPTIVKAAFAAILSLGFAWENIKWLPARWANLFKSRLLMSWHVRSQKMRPTNLGHFCCLGRMAIGRARDKRYRMAYNRSAQTGTLYHKSYRMSSDG